MNFDVNSLVGKPVVLETDGVEPRIVGQVEAVQVMEEGIWFTCTWSTTPDFAARWFFGNPGPLGTW